jgi:cell division protein FtsL
VTETLIWVWVAAILICAGLVGGVILAGQLLAHRGQVLDAREAKLNAEWEALRTAQRLNAAFMAARQAMAKEAIRQHREDLRHGQHTVG